MYLCLHVEALIQCYEPKQSWFFSEQVITYPLELSLDNLALVSCMLGRIGHAQNMACYTKRYCQLYAILVDASLVLHLREMRIPDY